MKRAHARANLDHDVTPEGVLHTFYGTFFGALAVVLSIAPWNLFPLAFVALIPILAVTRGISDRRAFLRGWLFGILVNLGGFPWVIDLVVNFGDMPSGVGVLLWILLSAQQGFIAGVAFYLARHVERWLGWKHGFALPFTYVAAELLIPIAFPWKLGHSQVFHLYYLQLADIGGVPLMTFGVVLINVGIYHWMRQARRVGTARQLPAVMWCAVAFFVFAQVYGIARVTAVDAEQGRLPTIRVGMVEADLEIEEKWDTGLYPHNLYLHQELSVRAVEEGAELVIWPESAYEQQRYFYQTQPEGPVIESRLIERGVHRFPPSTVPLESTSARDAREPLTPQARLAPQRGFRVPLLTGTSLFRVTTQEEMETLPPYGNGMPRRGLTFNSSILLDADGVVRGIADKVQMMPISEQIPGAQTIYDLTGVNLYGIVPASGLFGSGDGPVVLSHQHTSQSGEAREVRLGILNCYEDLMPGFVREMTAQRPDFLVNQTNDAWFGRAMTPAQHMALSVPRAVEARTWLLRATNTGVSAFIDATGRVRARTSTRDAEYMVMDVPLKPAGDTPFRRLGNSFSWLCLLLCGAAIVGGIRRRRAEGA